MAIRVTQNSIAQAFQQDVQSIYTRMARTQQQMADGRRIQRPSDDPFGTGQVLGFDTQLSDVRAYQTNVKDAVGVLDAADSALDSVTKALQRIGELASQAANGTNGTVDRQSIAAEMLQLKEVVRDGLNTQQGGQFVFGGTATASEPYPAPGNAYVGTANTMSKLIGAGQTVQVNVAGTAIVGPNGANTLDVIDALITDVQGSNWAGIQTGRAAIATQTDLALDVRTQLGASAARLEATLTRLELTEERLMAARTEVADIDPTEAYMEFSQQQTMYQAALAAGTRIMQTSILDFI